MSKIDVKLLDLAYQLSRCAPGEHHTALVAWSDAGSSDTSLSDVDRNAHRNLLLVAKQLTGPQIVQNIQKLTGNNINATQNGRAKLNEWQAREILRLRTSGRSARDVGMDFGISAVAVNAIWRRDSWRHISVES